MSFVRGILGLFYIFGIVERGYYFIYGTFSNEILNVM